MSKFTVTTVNIDFKDVLFVKHYTLVSIAAAAGDFNKCFWFLKNAQIKEAFV